MEQIPEFENSDRRSRITKLAEKAKKLLKIGMIASIGVSSSAGSNTKESTKNMDRLNEYPVEHFDQKAHSVHSNEEVITRKEKKNRIEAKKKEEGIVSRLLSEYENKIDKIKTNKSTYKQSEENLNKHILYLEEQIHSLKESYKEVVEDLKDVEKSAYGIYLAHKKSTHLPYDTEHLWLQENRDLVIKTIRLFAVLMLMVIHMHFMIPIVRKLRFLQFPKMVLGFMSLLTI